MKPRVVRTVGGTVPKRTPDDALEHFRQDAEAKLGTKDLDLDWSGTPGESAVLVFLKKDK